MSENKADPLREALKPLAAISLWRDKYQDGPDILTNDKLARYFTADQVRAARAALAAPQPAAPLGGREAAARKECLRRDIDPDDICADGGVTAWMVVDQETRRHPIEILWRKHDLPEWFLGNGGTNTKLYALYDAILTIPQERADRAAIIEECAKVADAWISDNSDFQPRFLRPKKFATDAVKDVADAIRALAGKETGR